MNTTVMEMSGYDKACHRPFDCPALREARRCGVLEGLSLGHPSNGLQLVAFSVTGGSAACHVTGFFCLDVACVLCLSKDCVETHNDEFATPRDPTNSSDPGYTDSWQHQAILKQTAKLIASTAQRRDLSA